MRIHYRSQALLDLEEIFHYIDQRSPGGARNVIGAIHDAIAQIAEHPLSTRTSHPGIHVKVVRRYPYKIFYQVVSTASKFCMYDMGHAALGFPRVSLMLNPPTLQGRANRDRSVGRFPTASQQRYGFTNRAR